MNIKKEIENLKYRLKNGSDGYTVRKKIREQIMDLETLKRRQNDIINQLEKE